MIELQAEYKPDSSGLPEGFSYINDIAPNIVLEIRYATTDNFTGKVVDGYKANVGICTTKAAYVLRDANEELNTMGLGLKIFDAYRPLKACEFFIEWSQSDEENPAVKAKYYPDFEKKELFELGYIVSISSHCRGSTVDLTIIDSKTGKELEMGTEFDFLGERSHTASDTVSDEAKANRDFFVKIMDKYGFDNYKKEWWHYTLRNEPFDSSIPENYFNFDVDGF